MFSRIILVLMLARLTLGIQLLYPVGSEVHITLRNGSEFTGEILAVRDSCIVFSSMVGASNEQLARSKNTVTLMRFDGIHEISLPSTGSSKVLLGVLLGGPAGFVTGAAIGRAIDVEQKQDDQFGCEAAAERTGNAVTGGLIGCFVGAFVGGGVGSALSAKDIVLISPASRDFSRLEPLARFHGNEPEFLREVR